MHERESSRGGLGIHSLKRLSKSSMPHLGPSKSTCIVVNQEHEEGERRLQILHMACGDAFDTSTEEPRFGPTPVVPVKLRSTGYESNGVESREGTQRPYRAVLQNLEVKADYWRFSPSSSSWTSSGH